MYSTIQPGIEPTSFTELHGCSFDDMLHAVLKYYMQYIKYEYRHRHTIFGQYVFKNWAIVLKIKRPRYMIRFRNIKSFAPPPPTGIL